MNWKNITIEPGFIRQEINVNGANAVNYIPVDQIDSFGVVSTENKRWLYAGIFFSACALLMAFNGGGQGTLISAIIAVTLIGIYFLTRKTWLSITSNQTKFSVQIMTTDEELRAVNEFTMHIKNNIHACSTVASNIRRAPPKNLNDSSYIANEI